MARPSRLDNSFVFHSVVRDQLDAKVQRFSFHRNFSIKKITKNTIIMDSKIPFNKDNGTKISFSELVELIGTTCDYKFCIIDETIDDELMELAAKHGINLTGFKHVIETSGVQHAENDMEN